jgi:hypothetical protein
MFQPRSFLISSRCFLDLVRSLIPCWAVTDLLTSPSQSFRLLVPNCEPATLRVAVSDTALCRPEPAPFPRGDCGCPLSQLDRVCSFHRLAAVHALAAPQVVNHPRQQSRTCSHSSTTGHHSAFMLRAQYVVVRCFTFLHRSAIYISLASL